MIDRASRSAHRRSSSRGSTVTVTSRSHRSEARPSCSTSGHHGAHRARRRSPRSRRPGSGTDVRGSWSSAWTSWTRPGTRGRSRVEPESPTRSCATTRARRSTASRSSPCRRRSSSTGAARSSARGSRAASTSRRTAARSRAESRGAGRMRRYWSRRVCSRRWLLRAQRQPSSAAASRSSRAGSCARPARGRTLAESSRCERRPDQE